MILNKTPITLAEVKSIIGKEEEGQEELRDYLKKFTKLAKDKADKLIEEVNGLKNAKLKEIDVIKIADFLPRDAESLNKVVSESAFSEEEINAILDVVKKY